MTRMTVNDIEKLIEYDPDTGALQWKPRNNPVWDKRYAGKECLTTSHRGVRRGLIHSKWYHAHYVAYALMEGEWPTERVYFRDGDSSNLKWSNIATGSVTDALSVGRGIPSNIETNAEGTRYRCRFYVNGYKFTSSYKQYWREALLEADERKAFLEDLREEHGLAAAFLRNGEKKYRVWLPNGTLSKERFDTIKEALWWENDHVRSMV